MRLHQTKKFLHSKNKQKPHQQSEKKAYEMGKIFVNHISDKGLVFKIYKELAQFCSKRIVQLRHGQRIWIAISPKNTYERPKCTWKGAQHHQELGERKLKLRYHFMPIKMTTI